MRISFSQLIQYAGFHVTYKELFLDPAEGGTYRGKLVQNVVAVAIFLNHLLDPPDLTFDPVQPFYQPLFEFFGMMGFSACFHNIPILPIGIIMNTIF